MGKLLNFSNKRAIYLVSVLLLAFGCKDKNSISINSNPINIITKDNISIEVYDYKSFEPFLDQKDDNTYIINFWATWCRPCIEELPYLEQIGEKYKNEKVKVILVSLDFQEKIEDQVIPFVKQRNIKSKVVLLDAPDANSWIPKINKDWSGAIPATLIYNKGKRAFYEQSFTYEELEKEILKFIN